MDKKTKHRILGVLVIVGLVVIMLPFFQGGNELSTETTLVKAPPFPDQSMQVIASDPLQSEQAEPVEPVTEPEPVPAAQKVPAPKPAEITVNQQPDDTISNQHPVVKNMPAPEANSKAAPQAKTADNENDDSGTQLNDDVIQVDIPANKLKTSTSAVTSESRPQLALKRKPTKAEASLQKVKIIPHSIAHTHNIEVLSASSAEHTMNDNGLLALKNAVWVIQLGSFKNKANALRLVNRLRSSGYPAFIQKISTTFGESTRVFVGPEYKKDSAHALAMKLDNDLHLHGIVISYKPLTL